MSKRLLIIGVLVFIVLLGAGCTRTARSDSTYHVNEIWRIGMTNVGKFEDGDVTCYVADRHNGGTALYCFKETDGRAK